MTGTESIVLLPGTKAPRCHCGEAGTRFRRCGECQGIISRCGAHGSDWACCQMVRIASVSSGKRETQRAIREIAGATKKGT